MNEGRTLDDQDAIRWLDRLADGELDEPSRQRLFEWLECDPERWRRCALSLLEARELQLALGEWVSDASAPTLDLRTPAVTRNSRQIHRTAPNPLPSVRTPLSSIVATVAAVVIAFGMGIAADHQWMGRSQIANVIPLQNGKFSSDGNGSVSGPTYQVVRQKMPTVDRQVPGENSNPFVGKDVDSMEMVDSDLAPLPDYVRSQFERCGYRVNSEQKVISLTLSDGREMAIPVEEWKFQYAGIQAY